MSVFKNELKNMVLSDKIKVFNCLNGSVYSPKGSICGLKDNKVFFINLGTLKCGYLSIELFEEFFNETIDSESDIMLKRACEVLFD